MAFSRKILSAAMLFGLWSLAVAPAAYADNLSPTQRRFLNLVILRQLTGQPENIPLSPRLVTQFDRTYSQAARKNGPLLPPLLRLNSDGSFPVPRNINQEFRQQFIYELLRQRAALLPFGGSARLFTSLGGNKPQGPGEVDHYITPKTVTPERANTHVQEHINQKKSVTLNILQIIPAYEVPGPPPPPGGRPVTLYQAEVYLLVKTWL